MKWQELKDNIQAQKKLKQRAEIFKLIRRYFDEAGFLEIDSPLLVAKPGLEPNLNPMEVLAHQENGQPVKGYLITSPELSLKKALAGGLLKIFQLGKCFRDHEPWGENHNPEFTMLEWYETSADYKDIMARTEELTAFVAQKLSGALKIKYQGREIDLTPPWPKLSMTEAWQKYAGADLNNYLDYDKMAELAKSKGYTIKTDDSFDDLFFKIFLSEVEPRLTELNRPVFIYDYPAQMAALSRIKKEEALLIGGQARWAERFELYIAGLELANAYSELTDADEQRARFEADIEKRKELGKEPLQIDEDLLAALKNIPPCGGIALGVDRLVMLLTDSKTIGESLFLAAGDLFNTP